jgi:hypothetical protein
MIKIRELIIASSLTIISINLTAQERISSHKDNMIPSIVNRPVMENDLMGMLDNKQSMCVIARETTSVSGKGTIVSNQAKQMGSAKRKNSNKENIASRQNESGNRNRNHMHASPMRSNPDLIGLNTVKGLNRHSLNGRK